MTTRKIGIAIVATLALGLGARLAAADQPSGGPTPEQRQQMREWCKQNQEECHAKMKQRAEEWFKKVDTDGDGSISRQEAEAKAPRLAKHFDQIDADHDSKITREELRAARKEMHERHRERGGPDSQQGGQSQPQQ